MRVLRAAALVLVLGALPAARAALRPAYGGRVVIGAAGPLTAVDPALARSDVERLHAAAVACTLADVLAGAPEPLADGRVRLRLQDNLFFHDGTRITAPDVVRSLSRLADPALAAPSAWRLLAFEGAAARLSGEAGTLALSAVGPLTLEAGLAVPAAALVRLLDDPRVPLTKADGIGCGPFRPEAAEGEAVRLTPFDRHPAGRPFLDRITLRPVKGEEGAQLVAAGALDLALGRIARRAGRADGPLRHGTYLLVRGEGAQALALRRALDAALDRDALVRFLVGGSARPLHAPIPLAAPAPAPAPASPATLAPTRLVLAFEAGHEVHRWVAERIQVRLHDLGVEVVLAPGADAGATDLALATLPGLPEDPALALVAVVHAFHGPRAAAEVLTRVTAAGDDPEALAALAAAVARELPAVPLYAEADPLFLRTGLLGAIPARGLPFEPAELWRWPLASPPEAP